MTGLWETEHVLQRCPHISVQCGIKLYSTPIPIQRKRCGQEEFCLQVCFQQILKHIFGCWQQTDIGQSPFTVLGPGTREEESGDAKIFLEALNSTRSFLMRIKALQGRYSTHPSFLFISILSFLWLWATVSGWALETWVVQVIKSEGPH